MTDLTIVNYHYVHNPGEGYFKNGMGLSVEQFQTQLDFLGNTYTFVKPTDVISAFVNSESLPPNACWLTFDDGYIDHYKNVAPILDERRIYASFFPPASPVTDREMLDVNKVQLILDRCPSAKVVIAILRNYLEEWREERGLYTYEKYWKEWVVRANTQAKNYESFWRSARYGDRPEIVFIKRMLQVALPRDHRQKLISDLFRDYVGVDSTEVAGNLYMTEEHLRELVSLGMHIGHHGDKHYWFDSITPAELTLEIDNGKKLLRSVGAELERWVIAYPYGAWNDVVLDHVKTNGCVLGLTVIPKIVDLNQCNPLLLNRFDTTDFPYSDEPKKTYL